MKTCALTVEGIDFVVPVHLRAALPDTPLASLPAACGAGNGIGQAAVPETLWGLRITPACFIHDQSWLVADPTWADFHQANSMFLHNILAIIRARSRSIFLEHLRNYRAVTFYNAVDTVGALVFRELKGEIS